MEELKGIREKLGKIGKALEKIVVLMEEKAVDERRLRLEGREQERKIEEYGEGTVRYREIEERRRKEKRDIGSDESEKGGRESCKDMDKEMVIGDSTDKKKRGREERSGMLHDKEEMNKYKELMEGEEISRRRKKEKETKESGDEEMRKANEDKEKEDRREEGREQTVGKGGMLEKIREWREVVKGGSEEGKMKERKAAETGEKARQEEKMEKERGKGELKEERKDDGRRATIRKKEEEMSEDKDEGKVEGDKRERSAIGEGVKKMWTGVKEITRNRAKEGAMREVQRDSREAWRDRGEQGGERRGKDGRAEGEGKGGE